MQSYLVFSNLKRRNHALILPPSKNRCIKKTLSIASIVIINKHLTNWASVSTKCSRSGNTSFRIICQKGAKALGITPLIVYNEHLVAQASMSLQGSPSRKSYPTGGSWYEALRSTNRKTLVKPRNALKLCSRYSQHVSTCVSREHFG